MIDDVLTRHAVRERGVPGGRPMLFAHGFGCDQSLWHPPAANGAEFGFWLPAGPHNDPEMAASHAPDAAGRPAVDA